MDEEKFEFRKKIVREELEQLVKVYNMALGRTGLMKAINYVTIEHIIRNSRNFKETMDFLAYWDRIKSTQ
ncbi:MAG: hypothetical protein NT076_01020 [Candidatus Pacearchaeota archaeon]|nr:hypothetical protein [Candidatus Pacearchaeota archaeon]